jgi:hypothetical protein
MNVQPYATLESAENNHRKSFLPPHPLTVLQSFVETHTALVLSLVSTIPSQWIHFMKCDPELYDHFTQVTEAMRIKLTKFVYELKAKIEFIRVDHSDFGPPQLNGVMLKTEPKPKRQRRRPKNQLSDDEILAAHRLISPAHNIGYAFH